MQLKDRTVLITGGSEGIGMELAATLARDNRVVICGRSEAKLARARERVPTLHTHVCDVTEADQRSRLVEKVLTTHHELDVLVNNAGAKTPTALNDDKDTGSALRADMALNFTAPVALTMALLPHLKTRPAASIINMTTGLVYLAKAEQAFYCTAKAALHSFTQSLRWTLRDSPVSLHEVMLTLVDTGFHRGRLPQTIPALTAAEAAHQTLKGLARGREEIRIGKARLAPWLALLAPYRGLRVVNGG